MPGYWRSVKGFYGRSLKLSPQRIVITRGTERKPDLRVWYELLTLCFVKGTRGYVNCLYGPFLLVFLKLEKQ
jgi:hypothetical protein